MSFRELRLFCEVMRSLGYPRLISMENFRAPNFELTADILDWLVHRLEPNCPLSDDISTQAHRVEFIKGVTEKVVLRTGVKLNPRKLYGADGYAVKEVLKLATVLVEAHKNSAGQASLDALAGDDHFALNSKLSDLKATRSLCSQIVETGAGLFDSLQKEAETRKERDRALRFLDGISKNLESNSGHDVIERAVSGMLSNHGSNLEQLKKMTEDLQRDEKQLEQKAKKKQQELDRCRARLSNLANVRPAFMEEYERLEEELERFYEQYVGRFRNLDYLEHELDMLNRQEKERMEENERAMKKMQKRLRDEEWALLRGLDEDGKKAKPKGSKKPSRGRAEWMPGSSGGNVSGGMEAADDDESSESESDSDPPISVGGSDSEDPPVSLGGSGPSGSDDDILNESDEDRSVMDDDRAPARGMMRGGRNDYNF